MNWSFLKELKLEGLQSGSYGGGWLESSGDVLESKSPHDNQTIGKVVTTDRGTFERIVSQAREVFLRWRLLPAPKRGEIIRQIGEEFRNFKEPLGRLVSLENGKIYQEGLGEVQEAIDIADYALGLSRQLYGVTTHSERPCHRLYEQWHPLGINGFITAFNFPIAVWSWNTMISAVCGNTMIWKPSSKTPLCAIAAQKIVDNVLVKHGFQGIMNLCIGPGDSVGEWLISEPQISLISFTGSCKMGHRVNEVVSKRLGRCLLELGGNNAVLVMESADMELALRAVLFGAVGTAGQRCTSTRRLILHEAIAGRFITRLKSLYERVVIGDPLDDKTLMGPLIDKEAVMQMQKALARVKEEGGEILYGGEPLETEIYAKGNYVRPCLVKAHAGMGITQDETFAPILYIFIVKRFEEAMGLHNGVPQGLSSSLFTNDLRESERFLSHEGSDCGIANINVGTSGAEIGLAFGGEKETGGGREAGSDSWKYYMRRQTNTINFGSELPLAQGISFDVT